MHDWLLFARPACFVTRKPSARNCSPRDYIFLSNFMSDSSGIDYAHNASSVITASTYTIDDMASNSIKLLTGNSHPALAKAVADRWGTHVLKLRAVLTSTDSGSSLRRLWCFSTRTKRQALPSENQCETKMVRTPLQPLPAHRVRPYLAFLIFFLCALLIRILYSFHPPIHTPQRHK